MATIKKYIIRLIFTTLVFLNLVNGHSFAQNTAHLRLSDDSILIGDQVKLKMSARIDHDVSNLTFPSIPDTFSKIEILDKGRIDTVRNKDYNIYEQELLITCFDSGSYNFPLWHISIIRNNGDTQEIPITSTTLYVNTINEVDTSLPIKPIFDIEPEEAPDLITKIKEIYEGNKTAFWIGAVFIMFIVIAFLAYWFYFRKRKRLPRKSIELPYIKAQRLVAELEQSGLWQDQKYKEYYSHLSEVLKSYFEEQFSINANEMTTRDFLRVLKKNNDWRGIHSEMRQILQIADITKFAKGMPSEEDHLVSVKNAIKIIEQTRPQVVQGNDQ